MDMFNSYVVDAITSFFYDVYPRLASVSFVFGIGICFLFCLLGYAVFKLLSLLSIS